MTIEEQAEQARRREPVRRPFPVFWLVITLLVVAGVATAVITSTSESEDAARSAGEKAPVFADVDVNGPALPTFDAAAQDRAVGKTIPVVSGTDTAGKPMEISPRDGSAKVVVVVAHWCPHCRAEVPRIVSWAKDNELPKGVEIVTVSTSVSEGQPNFPPAAWLTREDWTWDVLVDDEIGTAAEALGVAGFPFLLFIKDDGTVDQRVSGEMPIDEFDAAVQSLAPVTPPR